MVFLGVIPSLVPENEAASLDPSLRVEHRPLSPHVFCSSEGTEVLRSWTPILEAQKDTP